MDQTPQFEYRSKQLKLNRVVTAALMVGALVVITFPLLVRARGRLIDKSCASNLGQIYKALALYSADNDNRFPAAVDASDKQLPQLWEAQASRAKLVKKFPLLNEALKPYVKNTSAFKCPLDNGGYIMDNTYDNGMTSFLSQPTMYDNYGFSYLYRTEITFRSLSQKGFWPGANIAMLFDGYGHWHGRTEAIDMNTTFRRALNAARDYKYNALFGDGHVDMLSYDELQQSWAERL